MRPVNCVKFRRQYLRHVPSLATCFYRSLVSICLVNIVSRITDVTLWWADIHLKGVCLRYSDNPNIRCQPDTSRKERIERSFLLRNILPSVLAPAVVIHVTRSNVMRSANEMCLSHTVRCSLKNVSFRPTASLPCFRNWARPDLNGPDRHVNRVPTLIRSDCGPSSRL